MTAPRLRRFADRLLETRGLVDPEEIRRAQLIAAASVALIFYLLAASLEGVIDHNPTMIAAPLFDGLLAGVVYHLARRGQLAAAERASLLLVLVTTMAVIAVQGTAASRLGVIHVGVVFLGLAVRPGIGLAHAALSVVLVLAAVGAERAGVPIPLSPTHQPAWFGILRLIFMITALMAAFDHGFQRLLAAFSRHTVELEAAHVDLVAARERLERLVVARTAELQRANADLEAFASTLSHDLRAPLRHVSGFLEMFAQDATDLDETRLHPIAEVRASVALLGGRLEAILARSRPPRVE